MQTEDIQHEDRPETQGHLKRFRAALTTITRRVSRRPLHLFIAVGFLVSAIVSGLYVSHLHEPPTTFPLNEPIYVTEGMTLKDVTEHFAKTDVVHSSFLLQVVVDLHFTDRPVRAETYYFEEPLSTTEVARAITSGTHSISPIRITIPEGLRIEQIDRLASERIPQISSGEFSEAAEGKEGYLFPETYHLSASFTAAELVDLMERTFNERVAPLMEEIENSRHSMDEIITMASLIEREAKDERSKQLVSGILWKRYEIGMPLQADAAFEYIYDKPATELTSEDLQVESPYNTYTNIGLPPTPIANPGLESIEAALNPEDSPYLYYITGSDGNFYYAETYAEHQENIEHYLK